MARIVNTTLIKFAEHKVRYRYVCEMCGYETEWFEEGINPKV